MTCLYFFASRSKGINPGMLHTFVGLACFFILTAPASALPLHSPVHSLPGNVLTGTKFQDTTTVVYDTPSSYPGGAPAWSMHLMKNLRYPLHARNEKIVGQVMVNFTINEKGRLSDFEALSGPKELIQEAIRVIKAGGKWTPAMLKGQPVVSQRQQAITFRLE